MTTDRIILLTAGAIGCIVSMGYYSYKIISVFKEKFYYDNELTKDYKNIFNEVNYLRDQTIESAYNIKTLLLNEMNTENIVKINAELDKLIQMALVKEEDHV